ncbi:MAG: hypothetical protein FJZ01_03660 [Candidatus Sericytochromatia bacterium]|nr:hypothetical protein [Candidatus Tanganyikabacteria bacterium]
MPGDLHESTETLAGAPALLVWRGDRRQAAATGTILFYHGLGAAKEANRPELHDLARRGFLAIGIDVVGHGERRYPDFESRFGAADPRPECLQCVAGSVGEVPRIVDALAADAARFGIAGISLGAYILYGALLADRRLQVAAAILGSPRWWFDPPDSPHRHPDRFFPRALLSQNAGRDENVPPGEAQAFHAALSPHYQAAPDRQRHVMFPHSGHFMNDPDWRSLWDSTLTWFDRHLKQA